MNLKTFINDWIAASNAFDTKKYLDFYLPDAILEDPSVGRKFIGHQGITDYFDSYFIGYNTHISLTRLEVSGEHHTHLEVKITGDFPEGNIGGAFDF